jgi:FkbM family methyltransferase
MRNHLLFRQISNRTLDHLLPDRVFTFPVLAGVLRGFVLKINPRWERQFIYGRFETELVKAINSVVAPGHVVYDVGAHIGYFTLLFAKAVGSGGSVFAFEPSPAVFKRLHSNIELNRNRIRSKVELMQQALYDEVGQKKFFLGGSPSTGRLVRFSQAVGDSMMTLVPVTTIDDLVASGLPSPNVIKIDAEYVEDRVIQGSVRTLKDRDTIVLCEVHSEDLGGTILTILKKLGYEIIHLETKRAWDHIDHVSRGHILAYPRGKCFYDFE